MVTLQPAASERELLTIGGVAEMLGVKPADLAHLEKLVAPSLVLYVGGVRSSFWRRDALLDFGASSG